MKFIKSNLALIIVSCLLCCVIVYDVFLRPESIDKNKYDLLIDQNKAAIANYQTKIDSLTCLEDSLINSINAQSKRVHDDSVKIIKLKQKLYDSQKIIDTFTPSDVVNFFNQRYGTKQP